MSQLCKKSAMQLALRKQLHHLPKVIPFLVRLEGEVCRDLILDGTECDWIIS
jgi:hypothetical protein